LKVLPNSVKALPKLKAKRKVQKQSGSNHLERYAGRDTSV
jgi:hypothetical protein